MDTQWRFRKEREILLSSSDVRKPYTGMVSDELLIDNGYIVDSSGHIAECRMKKDIYAFDVNAYRLSNGEMEHGFLDVDC